MKTKLLFLVACLIIAQQCILLKAQQIGNGAATYISSFNVPLSSGLYQTVDTQPGFPDGVQGIWNHLLVIRHSNPQNNFQFQLAGNYLENDRLFFRKIASQSLTDRNSDWHELATRGYNKYTGNQHIPLGYSLIVGNDSSSKQFRLSYFGDENRGDAYIDYSHELFFRNENTGSSVPLIHFTNQGNVAIGKLGASEKLEVNGTIRAREVKIESSGWADFVFAPDYQLPSLEAVSNHIKEHQHLPDMPSAAEVEKEGINLSEMQAKLLQKIEELTLYAIEQNKRIEELEGKLKNMPMK